MSRVPYSSSIGSLRYAMFGKNRDGVIEYVDSNFTTVALSTIEADYIAITEAFKETVWLKSLFGELRKDLQITTIFCDSQSAMFLTKDQMFHESVKLLVMVILCENTKHELIATSYLPLKHNEQVKYINELPAVNPRILLSGPAGSEIYQEILVKALAHFYGAKLLIFDSDAFRLSVKDAEPMEGTEASSSLTANDSISSLAGPSKNTVFMTGIDCHLIGVFWAFIVWNTSHNQGPGSGRYKLGIKEQFMVPGSEAQSRGPENQEIPQTDLQSPLIGVFRAFMVQNTRHCQGPGSGRDKGPAFGTRGKIVLSFKDSPSAKVGVQFDKPIPRGINLGGLCEDADGFFCKVDEPRLEGIGLDDLENLLVNTLFEVVIRESRNSPVILFMKDAEKTTAGNSVSYPMYKSWLEKIPDNIVVIGSHIHSDDHKEESQLKDLSSPNWAAFYMSLPSRYKLFSFFKELSDSFGKMQDKEKQVASTNKFLTKLFPNKVVIHMSQVPSRIGLECNGLETLCIKDHNFSVKSAEKVVGWALSHHLMRNTKADVDMRLVLSPVRLCTPFRDN
ncbi:hypothetical protein BC332_17220 [Capsicum chinense]|nr:hypothetical protein BC332_17220 [Capsicum chinense]